MQVEEFKPVRRSITAASLRETLALTGSLPRLAGGAMQTWQTLINAYQYSGENTGTVYENSETITDVSPGANTAGQALTIPANYLVPGNLLRVTASGIYSTTGTPKLVLGVYWGAVAGVSLLVSGEMTTPSIKNQTWRWESTHRVTAVGTAGKMVSQGQLLGVVTAGSATATSSINTLPVGESSTGGESASIETGAAKILSFGATWKTKSAENKLTVYQWLVEILN